MTGHNPNPPGPLEFQIVLRARTGPSRDRSAGKWVNVVLTQVYDEGTMDDYDGMAIDVDLETVQHRIKQSLLGRYP